MKKRRSSLKWITFIGIGIVLLVVAEFCIWDSNERSKEIQQIELKLGFEVKVLDRQSHGTLKAPTRTYLVKRLDDKQSDLQYRLYLNEEDKIEQWAKVKNGKTIRIYRDEEE
ncbi:hypothetical protein OR571_15730 [Psychrobacillus sp. NEAU-3TGS]|uniref:hypothetical protein n=1 Tax=Psychrobacillus sp. NEAU-3TGS TaxID=2995412 RepID=UPI0024961CC4|nr:hypothetical protein [Psychrobacillus sp. NEAU-3TGS]MDI2588524.1 hypothetical protein [Psychrobacillus sp. NEAU-3TGS]